ncbi:MAG: PQQ-binding-like beta-propeller repeat protein [Acidimicrobiales bacterium]
MRGTKMAAVLALLASACSSPLANEEAFPAPTDPLTTATPSTTTAVTTSTSTSTSTTTRPPAVPGLLTFRGNATRTYYGQGPVPASPAVLRRFPDQPMCSESAEANAPPTRWCGTGWTGQPAVVERNGTTWLIFGAYDGAVHFVDADTGRRLLPDFQTGDLVKGSVTIDPDGYPLVYIGSRDNNFRVIAIDRPVPTELWRLPADAVSPVLWNDDWDGAALVVDDYLFEGGENSQWHAVKLNRSYGAGGLVSVRPELVFHAPGWDAELLGAIGDYQVSIEGSVAIHASTLYFANSGGLVQGWDIGGLKDGRDPTRTFRYWTGDDTDATVVVDDEGMLYVGSEWERHTDRARQVGQILKLDPRRADPLVWSVADQSVVPPEEVAGVWATLAIHRDLVIVPTNGGRLLGIDRRTGAVRWTKHLPGPLWQSPVVVDNVLLQGDCYGILHAYDVSNTAADPPELWTLGLGGCIESTPAVWKGRIYVGTRAGFVLTIADR